MAGIVDDKSKHCISFILQRLNAHRQGLKAPPVFFIGLQGVQGAGKTTLVETLRSVLTSPPHSLSTLVLSIDDLYLKHADQESLAQAHPDNPLVQHRGQPSTHDIQLGAEVFDALERRSEAIKIPSYDKAAHNGSGDRRHSSDWEIVNPKGQNPVDVVIFEGWCVGFRSLPTIRLEKVWQAARHAYANDSTYKGQLGKHELSSVEFVNDALMTYDIFTDRLSCFIQIAAEDPMYVYDWRLQQEAALRRARGTGMTDEQVSRFVDGYYPAYELYTQVLDEGIFNEPGKQLRLTVNRDRRVQQVIQL